MSGLDRRTFLKTAAASPALVVPATVAMQSPEASPERPSKPYDTGRKEQPIVARGFSKARLARMHDVMAGHVEHGAVPGLVTLVSRRGETHVDAIGVKSVGGRDPMRRDTIFRIASMTKPITAAAAMILVEECKLRLDEPVDRLLPELAGRKVLKRIEGPLDDTVPANRPISVRDLLTFRMGMGLILAPPGTYPIQKAMAEAGLAPGAYPPQFGPDEYMKRLGGLPLVHQPGERWMYGTGSTVLGVLIARASGQPLDTFFHERIFEPLGMKDTAFSLPTAKLDRLAACYQANPQTGTLDLMDGARDSRWGHSPSFLSGGGGLVSTVDDYLAFGQMMLNKGKRGNERILSRPSVELMTSDHITPEQKAASPFFPGFWDSHGWGFGLSVVTRRDNVASNPGRFGWYGGFGTSGYSDPNEDMVALLMTQRVLDPVANNISADFWTSAYQAIDD